VAAFASSTACWRVFSQAITLAIVAGSGSQAPEHAILLSISQSPIKNDRFVPL
jgi:hypothetical protein